MISCGFFERSCYVITFYVRVYVGLSYVSLVVYVFQKSNCFCYGFVLRLFSVLLFLS